MFNTPRKASTISIVKNNSDKMEVLLMRRHLNDRFLPDYLVFPGGAVDQQDLDYRITGVKPALNLKDFDGSLDIYISFLICGIRETFEESGFLLAVDDEGNYPAISTEQSIKKFDAYRRDVFTKKISFGEMLKRENLSPAAGNCFYMNRWITPPFSNIRYDTRFFTAIAPENQEPSHDGDELVDLMWMTPAESLIDYRKDKIKLVMPTIKTLEFLSRFEQSEDVIKHFQE